MYQGPAETATTPRHVQRWTRLTQLSLLLVLLAACSYIEEPQLSLPEGESAIEYPEGSGDTEAPQPPIDPSDPSSPESPESPANPVDPETPNEPAPPNDPSPLEPDEPTNPEEPTDTPTPSEPGAGGPVLGAMLWQATMESGDQSEWRIDDGGGEYNSGTGDAYVSTKYARTGQYSLLMRIDTSSGSGHGTRQFRWKELEHADTITTFYAYFPQQIGLDRLNDWFNFVQWKTVKWSGKPGGAYAYNDPLWTLDIHERGGAGSGGDNYLKLVNFDDPNGVSAEDAPAGMDLPVGEWFKITTHYRRATGLNGFIRVWLNDELMFDKKDIQTMRPDESYTGWSVNAYADITHPTVSEIFIDDVAIHLPN